MRPRTERSGRVFGSEVRKPETATSARSKKSIQIHSPRRGEGRGGEGNEAGAGVAAGGWGGGGWGGSGNGRRWCDKNRCHARARGVRGNRRSCDGNISGPNSHNSAPNTGCSAPDNEHSEPNTGCPEPNAHHSARDRDSSEPNTPRSARNGHRLAPNTERSVPAHRCCVPSWKEAPHHEWWEVLVAAAWPLAGLKATEQMPPPRTPDRPRPEQAPRGRSRTSCIGRGVRDGELAGRATTRSSWESARRQPAAKGAGEAHRFPNHFRPQRHRPFPTEQCRRKKRSRAPEAHPS